jgi:hypothetical protein
MVIEALVPTWTARAKQLREWAAAEEAAKAWEAAARELDAALKEDDRELLNLQEAARRSGYSPDHLGRLIREGKLPNAGRNHAPRIRAADLPRKPGALSASAPAAAGASRESIARAILSVVKRG